MGFGRFFAALGMIAWGAGCAASSGDQVAPLAIDEAATSTTDGHAVARGMLGLPAKASKNAYDTVATNVLAAVEAKKPGSIAALGRALSGSDPVKARSAFAATRRLIVSVTPPGAATTQALHVLDDAPAAIPVLGRGPDGRFGDDRTGPSGADADKPGFVADADRLGTLSDVNDGTLVPDPDSRLGAYAATAGYPAGTVGQAVHNAIGTIFTTFGTYGEEKIGRVFNDPRAKALYGDPVASASGSEMAQIELQYWNNVAKEDPSSPGGWLGSAFNAPLRDWLQQNVFGQAPAPLSASDCGDKTDGWWCLDQQLGAPGYMAYCKGGQVAGGCGCDACTTAGTPATCGGAPPPAQCVSELAP